MIDTVALGEIPEGVLHPRALPNGKRVVIARRGSEVRVFGESCPHMGADLAEARVCSKTGRIHCRWHGYVFDPDGNFIENPNERFMKLLRVESAHYKPGTTPRYKLARIPAVVRDGRVQIGQEGPE